MFHLLFPASLPVLGGKERFVTVSFFTFGCKVNQYETQYLARCFAKEGYQIVEGETAQVLVINSCTVTGMSDKKARQLLHRLRRKNPDSILVLCGCFPQAFPEQAAALEADVITGNTNRAQLPALVEQARKEKVIRHLPHPVGERFEPMEVHGLARHTRAFLKIQDGCERHCTYCIIPTARGHNRSKPLPALAEEAALLARQGYREIVLTGIDLTSYGRELGLRLSDAVAAASRPEGICRVRLGSLEPDEITDGEIAALAQCPKLCPQFHLSLQSGCDATLKRMGRRYDSAFYAGLLRRLRAAFPGCSFTTDVMVGFAGETEEEFAQSKAFVEQCGFAQIHLFPYSIRPGTPAAKLPQVPDYIKSRRMAQMEQVAQTAWNRFLEAGVGQVQQVLLESTLTPQGRLGHTADYRPVAVALPCPDRGNLVSVQIQGTGKEACFGIVLEKNG